jgi:hypothetical protein
LPEETDRGGEDAMRAGETELQMCVRHVAEQEQRIVRQEALIDRLRKVGSPLLDEALRLLAEMHDLMDLMREHAARL